MREGLGSSVTDLNVQGRLSDVPFVDPAKTSLEQFKADVLACDKYPGNQAPIAINRVQPQFDFFTEYQFAQGLLGALTEWLAFLRRINEGESNPDLLFLGGQHFDRIRVDNAYCAAADRLWLETQTVCDRLELILAENSEGTRENKQRDRSDGYTRAVRTK